MACMPLAHECEAVWNIAAAYYCLLLLQVTVASAKRRWYEATAGTTLFYLTKDPVDPITGFEV
jgi:hypothetical protein